MKQAEIRRGLYDHLGRGQDNAKTGRELAQLLGTTYRQVTRVIEMERRAGVPICASTAAPMGYYLASSRDDIQMMCAQLAHRQTEIGRTETALLATLDAWADEPGDSLPYRQMVR